MARQQLQRLFLPTAPHKDLGSAWLNRARDVECLFDAVVLAFERRPLFGKHLLDDCQRLVEPLHALFDRREMKAVSDVLGLVPCSADAHDRAAFGNDVECGHGLGQQRGVAVGHAGHEGGQLHARSLGRQRGKRRVSLEHGIGLRTHASYLVEVVHHGDHVEAGLLGRLHAFRNAIEQAIVRYPRIRVVRHVKSEESWHRNGNRGEPGPNSITTYFASPFSGT